MTRDGAIARIELAATEMTGTLATTTEPSAAEVLQRYIDAYDMAISALREQPQWISVEERLPEELVPVLIYEPEYARGYKSMATAFRINGCWHGCVDGAVTHWMPLPEPPEVEG